LKKSPSIVIVGEVQGDYVTGHEIRGSPASIMATPYLQRGHAAFIARQRTSASR